MSRPESEEGRRAPVEPSGEDPTRPIRVTTWPYLVRVELLATLAALVLVTVWSITIDAPLESAADANRTPDPSKAPWYFLGLQEILVYFDPWIAGVAIPFLIIIGLILIPYLDPNPEGNGYYTLRQRPFAVATFLFGFIVLWIVPIVIGVFCRGPGWNWYWPWESWSVPKTANLPNQNLSDLFGVAEGAGAFAIGALAVGGWYAIGAVVWWWKRRTPVMQQLGPLRYAILAFLFLSMMGIPLKMALRLGLNLKYVWVTPWFNV